MVDAHGGRARHRPGLPRRARADRRRTRRPASCTTGWRRSAPTLMVRALARARGGRARSARRRAPTASPTPRRSTRPRRASTGGARRRDRSTRSAGCRPSPAPGAKFRAASGAERVKILRREAGRGLRRARARSSASTRSSSPAATGALRPRRAAARRARSRPRRRNSCAGRALAAGRSCLLEPMRDLAGYFPETMAVRRGSPALSWIRQPTEKLLAAEPAMPRAADV